MSTFSPEDFQLTPEQEEMCKESGEGTARAQTQADSLAAGAKGLKRLGILFDYLFTYQSLLREDGDEEDRRAIHREIGYFCDHLDCLLHGLGFEGGGLVAEVQKISSDAFAFADGSSFGPKGGAFNVWAGILRLKTSHAMVKLREAIDDRAIAAAKRSSAVEGESMPLKPGAVAEEQEEAPANVAPVVHVDEVLLALGLTRESKLAGSDAFWRKHQITDSALRTWKRLKKVRAEADPADPKKRNLYYVVDAIPLRSHTFLNLVTKPAHRKSA